MPDTGVYLIQSYSYKEGYLRGGNQGSVDLVPVIVDAQPLANQVCLVVPTGMRRCRFMTD